METSAQSDRPDTFEKELENLLNRHNKEIDSNTPDFLLAEYLRDCLGTWNRYVTARERWYGRSKVSQELPDPPSSEGSRGPFSGADPSGPVDLRGSGRC
jgi:hypothetical protein